ncbi:hypothetical protein QUB61_33920, partial [Microcoleus sp. C2D2]
MSGTDKMPVPQKKLNVIVERASSRFISHLAPMSGTGKMPVPQKKLNVIVERASSRFISHLA